MFKTKWKDLAHETLSYIQTYSCSVIHDEHVWGSVPTVLTLTVPVTTIDALRHFETG